MRLEFSVIDSDIKIKAKLIADHVPPEEVVSRMQQIQLLRTMESVESLLNKLIDAKSNAQNCCNCDNKRQPKNAL